MFDFGTDWTWRSRSAMFHQLISYRIHWISFIELIASFIMTMQRNLYILSIFVSNDARHAMPVLLSITNIKCVQNTLVGVIPPSLQFRPKCAVREEMLNIFVWPELEVSCEEMFNVCNCFLTLDTSDDHQRALFKEQQVPFNKNRSELYIQRIGICIVFSL